MTIHTLHATVNGQTWFPEDGDDLEDFAAVQAVVPNKCDPDTSKYMAARAVAYRIELTKRFPGAAIGVTAVAEGKY